MMAEIMQKIYGRPAKFGTVEGLEEAIEGYFQSCFRDEPRTVKVGKEYHILYDNGKPVTWRVQFEPFTVTGLAIALGTTRETLMDVQNGNGPYKDNPIFSDAIKQAKLICENFSEKGLHNGGNPAGPIFSLKNYGWRDTQEIQMTGDIRITLDDDLDDLAE